MIPCVMTQVMYIEPYEPERGLDIRGDEVCGEQRTFCGIYKKRTRLARSQDGERFVTTHVIWTQYPIKENDRIWIPNADPENEEHAIQVQAVEYRQDPRGCRFYYKAIL